MTGALLTDRYELHMAASHLRRAMTAPATFSLYARTLPPDRGFLVATGVDDALAFLEDVVVDRRDADDLTRLGFPAWVVTALAGTRFTGEVWAVPEGRIVLAGEPILEVTAPLPEAQLVETALLNQVTFQTAIASKAARVRLAAGGAPVVDFSFRRTHGFEAGVAVARASAIVGFAATSNVEAARRFGLATSGTMAHSYVQAFPDELEAFRAFAADFPDATFLVDTYDTVQGVRHAITVIRELDLAGPSAVRLDSGDLHELSRTTRRLLDEAGLHAVRIVASGGLDEHDVAELVQGGAPIDAFGVGTRLGVSADAPSVDTVYKLVEYDGRPVMKLSAGKATAPGPKQVHRLPHGVGDVVALRDEPAPPGSEALLVRLMAGGRRLGPPSTVAGARQRFEADLADLAPAARALRDPVPPPVTMSPGLRALRDDLSRRLTTRADDAGRASPGPGADP